MFKVGDVVRDIPWTFKAMELNNSNRTLHFQAPKGATIQKDDLLLSENNKLYIVKATDTEYENNSGVFKGFRVLKTEL